MTDFDASKHPRNADQGRPGHPAQFAPVEKDQAPDGVISPEQAARAIQEHIADAGMFANPNTPLDLDEDSWLVLSHAEADFDARKVGFESIELAYDIDGDLDAVAVGYLDSTDLSADGQWIADNHWMIHQAFAEAFPGADVDIEVGNAVVRINVSDPDANDPTTIGDALNLVARDEVAAAYTAGGDADVWRAVRAKLAKHIPTPMPLTEIRPGDAVYEDGKLLGVAGSIDHVIGTYRPTTEEEANRPQVRIAFVDGQGSRGDATDRLVVDRSGAPLEYTAGGEYWANVTAAADCRQDPETLFQIAVDEPEDDFKLAIARNPSAGLDTLAIVAGYHGHQSRLAVIAHPNTSPETIKWIFKEAVAEEKADRQQAKEEGISPMYASHIAHADSAALVAAAAAARLADA